MPKQDLLWDDDMDILIRDGSIVIGVSDKQHQASILLMQAGECRQFGTLGVGIGDALNDDNVNDFPAKIQKNMEADGMYVKKVALYANGKLDLNAGYD
jgi:hypothetical protein